jgi:BirA family transcriptional regulator, biotin operon repressor / biotin---[acetyl-CoA-carboxylase] ligase
MNVFPLLTRLADGRFHSGQSLGQALGISRAAIWKQIKVLKDLGVDIHAVTGKGYRIPGGIDLLDRNRVAAGFDTETALLRDRFDLHFSTGSTNTDAMQKAESGEAVYLVMAEHQSQGRGRRGRNWVSPFGHNIYMSLLWSFQGGVAALEGLSLVCALVVVRALRREGFQGFQVKWPNDVLFQGRKLAGILLEVNGEVAGHCRLIIGIGVNSVMPLKAASEIDQPYSDLRLASGRTADRNSLAASLANELVIGVRQFEHAGFAAFREEWMRTDCYLGCDVEISAGNNRTTGKVAGVDEAGRLLLDTTDGRQVISGGELLPSLRPVGTGAGNV